MGQGTAKVQVLCRARFWLVGDRGDRQPPIQLVLPSLSPSSLILEEASSVSLLGQ